MEEPKEQFKMKKSVVAIAVIGLAAVGEASAAGTTVLTTAMATALADGFDSLKVTVGDVIALSWPYMLAVMALYAAPSIVKKLWNMVVR